VFADGPEYTTGIPDCDDIAGNILSHNTPGTDDRIIANGYTRQYYRVRADPNVIADAYRYIELCHSFTLFRLNGVSGSGQGDIGAEHNVIANKDMGVVDQRQIKVGIDTATQMGVLAPIGVQRGFDVAVVTHFSKDPAEQVLSALYLGWPGMVEIIESVKTLQLFLSEGVIIAKIDFLAVHLLFDIHWAYL
jgi:hypothetical protein